MGSDGRERGAAVWLRRIVVLGVALVVNLQGWAQETVGLDSKAFHAEKEMIMDSLQDLVSHFDKGEKDYENNLGEICFGNWKGLETDRIAIRETRYTKMVRFLGDLAGIELYMGSHRFELYNAPSLESCRELCDFYSTRPQNINLFTYWIIYNQWPDFETTFFIGLSRKEQMEFMFAEDEGKTEEFFKKHPDNTLYKNYQILKALREQCGLLYGILKSDE